LLFEITPDVPQPPYRELKVFAVFDRVGCRKLRTQTSNIRLEEIAAMGGM
jgi:hypothetical protein